MSGTASAQVIFRNIIEDKDTVFVGMAKFGNYTETIFEIENKDAVNYKIENINPSFIITKPINSTNNDFEEFNAESVTFPIRIPAESKIRIKIRYTPKDNYALYPLGGKTALLKFGVFPESFSVPPTQKEDMAYYKEYILRAKKVANDLDFIQNVVQLDSVCVNPSNPMEINLKIQNNSNSKIQIIREEIFYKSKDLLPQELRRTDTETNNEFAALNDYKVRKFEYYPMNRGWDTADYRVIYNTVPPTAQDTAIFKFIGFGVEQQLKLSDGIDAVISNDTIYIGNVQIQDSKNFKIIIKNLSNFPFGISSQAILKEQVNQNELAFTFDKYFLPGGKHLQVNFTDTANIKFSPTERKTYVGRLIIRSDINIRKISNANNASAELVYYIVGVGTSPDISLSTREIDFKTLHISDECPTVRDTAISIYNPGNQLLRINQIIISPSAAQPFEFDNSGIVLQPNEKKFFQLRLNTKGLEIGKSYEYKLIFDNNTLDNKTADISIKLSTAVLDNINIAFPKLSKAKTGRIIEIPIISEKSKIANANSFNCSISYNKDILEYSGYRTVGTASEPAINADIVDTGLASINVRCKSDISNFISRDTLFILKFKTYLSDTYTSPILFNNFKIGNQNCDNVFIVNYSDGKGEFKVDSVCGLEYKILIATPKTLTFNCIYPNPASRNINLDFAAKENGLLTIDILNQFGDVVQRIDGISYLKGNNTAQINIDDLPVGMYYMKAAYSTFQEIMKLQIVK